MSNESADGVLIERVLGHYDQQWTSFEVLPKWYGSHLRVHVRGRDGGDWQLRERPNHISRPDWCFHHLVQPTEPTVPTVPPLLRSREGDCMVCVDDRDFELIGWMEGQPRGVNSVADARAVGEALGELHRWLLEVGHPASGSRTTATTNDLDWWMGELRRDGFDLPALLRFCDVAEAALAELPSEPLVAVHGDVHPYNLLWENGRVTAFCDWEDSHLNVPSFDLAYLLAHCTLVDWPKRLPSGREAWVRESVEQDKTLAILRAYRSALGRALSVTGFQRALVVSWVVTMRLTVLRGFVDEPCALEGQRILDWLLEARNLKPWLEILGG